MNGITSKQKPIVVLDKSFVQGAKGEHLQELALEYFIAVTSSFYYEVLTMDDGSRMRALLGRLPEFHRIDTLGLCRQERETQQPSSVHCGDSITVNPDFISGQLVLTDAEKKLLRDYEVSFRPLIELLSNVGKTGVIGFEDSEIGDAFRNRPGFEQVCLQLREPDRIRQIAGALNFPCANQLDERWITFRRIQAFVLHGLTLKFSYPNSAQPRKEEELEHDIHDLDYLALGLHTSCFATNESAADYRKLGWKFKFLCPKGRLVRLDKGRISVS